MDFFQSQDVARRNTLKLVMLFMLALISLIAITNLLIMLTLGMLSATSSGSTPEAVFLIDWSIFAWISIAVVAVVAFGSLYKMASLSGGGARVAEMMQGKLIVDGTGDLDKQKILNIVEEMAIASGTPVPPVYLMDEDGINAFAAGYSQGDAVIGITRGAIQKLSRDELQGVIAHEFSHILHGDMRLNIRLIGILHGIMVLGLMGYYLLRTAGISRRSRNSGNIVFLAIGLIVIGFAGTFFGNMIKAAVSRQREFLADASAVQYTRNPDGIANALKRIGADAQGSVLENPAAAEISHALFSNGVRSSFNAMFATHPPLKKRILSIEPRWDGNFTVVDKRPEKASAEPRSTPASAAQRPFSGTGLASAILLTETILSQAGNPQEADVKHAKDLLASMPDTLREAAHNPFSARALVYLLLLAEKPETAAQQLQFLADNADKAVYGALQDLLKSAGQHKQIRVELRLPLINICLPALRQLSEDQYEMFKANMTALIHFDNKISLWEWVLQRVVLHQLDAVFIKRSSWQHKGQHTLKQLAPDCAVVLGFLIHAGDQQATDHAAAFAEAVVVLGMPELAMPDQATLDLPRLNAALNALSTLKPLQKPTFLKACAAGIIADGKTTAQELEIFRAIAATIDCPLSPLSQPVKSTAVAPTGQVPAQ